MLVRRVSVLAAALATIALPALPAISHAATVTVGEEPADAVTFGSANKAHLTFAAGPGENNGLVIAIAATEGDFLKLQVVDGGAAVEPGAKCSGGGTPGVPVTCTIHKPKAPDLQIIGGKVIQPIWNTGWDDDFDIDLGDGTNSFDASGVTAGGLSSDQVDMTVTGGAGEDTIRTGGGEDRIDPGAGVDSIHTGGAYDEVLATATADGPDVYDLGPEIGKVDYSARQDPVVFDGERAGAIGENDLLTIGLPWIVGGSGDDALVGGEDRDLFEGNDGNDSLRGGGGKDELIGGRGEDRIFGEDGFDLLVGEPGDDLLAGGRGRDKLRDALIRPAEAGMSLPLPSPPGPSGNDLGFGGSGADKIELGAGRDRLVGGPGVNLLDCGPGRDRATGNPWDTVRRCETVHWTRRGGGR